MAWVEKLPSGRFRGGYIDALGKKRQRGGFVHKQAAKIWAQDREEAARRGDLRDPNAGRTLFVEWAERWWEARVVEKSTASNEKPRYDEIVKRWGDYSIGSIGSLEVQSWIKEMSQAGRAPGTVRKYHGLLSAMLSAAVLPPDRLILENPCRHVTLPPLPQGREVFVTREQVDALDGELEHPWDTLTWLLAYTGLRWGEAVGLHVPRVDFLRRRIQVVDVIGQSPGFHLKAYPKGKRQRYVPMPDHLAERLAEHVKAFPPVDCGLHADCSGLLFSMPARKLKGQPVHRQTFGRWQFHPAAKRAKLPANLRVHDLRHSYASWLVQDGVSLREVQQLLGHSSITTTERYSHLAPDAGDNARKVLERAVRKATERPAEG